MKSFMLGCQIWVNGGLVRDKYLKSMTCVGINFDQWLLEDVFPLQDSKERKRHLVAKTWSEICCQTHWLSQVTLICMAPALHHTIFVFFPILDFILDPKLYPATEQISGGLWVGSNLVVISGVWLWSFVLDQVNTNLYFPELLLKQQNCTSLLCPAATEGSVLCPDYVSHNARRTFFLSIQNTFLWLEMSKEAFSWPWGSINLEAFCSMECFYTCKQRPVWGL